MKALEYIGVFFAAIGFILLSEGYMIYGFIVGALDCLTLAYVFSKTKQWPFFSLQLFFLTVNINGLINFWSI